MGWILYGLTLGLTPLLLLAWYREKEDRPVIVWRLVGRWSEVRRWLVVNYVPLIFSCAIFVLIWAAGIGLWRVPFLVGDLLQQLSIHSADPDKSRSIVTALAAVLAAIAIFGTIIVQSIRVWTNERQLTTIEQGHVTDRITKAVDQLGADKTVKRLVTDGEGDERTREFTEPNLEVRLGGIYALERIAQDSERDHLPIMEILCAYIRENAKAVDANHHDLGDWLNWQDPYDEGARLGAWAVRQIELERWIASLEPPRVDIQAVLTVLGRRTEKQRASETKAFDLRRTNLRKTNLRSAFLDGANLQGALLEGADLTDAHLNAAQLADARLERAILVRADLEGKAVLSNAHMEGVDATRAKMNDACLEGARLEGAILLETELNRANLTDAKLERAHCEAAHFNRASLVRAKMQLANLQGTFLEKASFFQARLDYADMNGADMTNAKFITTTMRSASPSAAILTGTTFRKSDLRAARIANWFGDAATALPSSCDLALTDCRCTKWEASVALIATVHGADLRGGSGLSQAMLDNFVGDSTTLLPDGISETGEPLHVWTCWDHPPAELDKLIDSIFDEFTTPERREAFRARLISGSDNPRQKTGTPLPLDTPYPEGHPLPKMRTDIRQLMLKSDRLTWK